MPIDLVKLDRLEAQLGEKVAAVQWLADEQRFDRESILAHELELPRDSEFRGKTAAELAAVRVERLGTAERPSPAEIRRVTEYDLARTIAPVRERMALRQVRIDAAQAEMAALSTLVKRLRKYAGRGTDFLGA